MKGGKLGGLSKQLDYNKEHIRKLRSTTIESMGGQCVKCGFTDKRALQFDHINGRGLKEGRDRRIAREVLRSFLNNEKKFQLLCANCNWIKRFENNEHGRRIKN